ncbi:hypothetical protein RFI_11514 [Reticulomyxa filosa]|uniref:Uncharacterized protein n=1 Tax=Reticulomyxa filosa TaxID=46433 RepID=X6NH25_RETFI|nr:hypothetical protein RFI_11514 [Reticulomyxa filosa]|eukprot:ETO25620.1 hypothetical protein RFI_11514 [Reticulomyxa filosa]
MFYLLEKTTELFILNQKVPAAPVLPEPTNKKKKKEKKKKSKASKKGCAKNNLFYFTDNKKKVPTKKTANKNSQRTDSKNEGTDTGATKKIHQEDNVEHPEKRDKDSTANANHQPALEIQPNRIKPLSQKPITTNEETVNISRNQNFHQSIAPKSKTNESNKNNAHTSHQDENISIQSPNLSELHAHVKISKFRFFFFHNFNGYIVVFFYFLLFCPVIILNIAKAVIPKVSTGRVDIDTNSDTDNEEKKEKKASASCTPTSEMAVNSTVALSLQVTRKLSVNWKDKRVIQQMRHILTNYPKKPVDIQTVSVVCNCTPSSIEELLDYMIDQNMVEIRGSEYFVCDANKAKVSMSFSFELLNKHALITKIEKIGTFADVREFEIVTQLTLYAFF